MAFDLDSIMSGATAEPPRILIYGTDGIGKSSWAAGAPNPIFTQTEDRLSHIDANKFPLCATAEDAFKTIDTLYGESHNFTTHVTDSADWLEKLIHKEICEEYQEPTLKANSKGSELSFGRGYVLAEQRFKEYLDALSYLRNEKGMITILTAHAEIKRFEDPMRDSYDKYWPSLHERVRDLLQQWADCIFFCNYQTFVKQEDGGFNKKEKKAVGAGARILYTEERPAFEAKNSYGLPAELPMPAEGPFDPFWEEYNAWIDRQSAKSDSKRSSRAGKKNTHQKKGGSTSKTSAEYVETQEKT